MTERSRLAYLGGVRSIRMGHGLIAVALVQLIIARFLPAFMRTSLLSDGGIATVGAVGVMISMIGIAHWCTVEDRRSGIAWLILIGGIVAIIVYFAEIMARVANLHPDAMPQIIGLLAESGLLAGQALLMGILRSLAILYADGKLRAWSEQSIAMCAIAVLFLIPLTVFGPIVQELKLIGLAIAASMTLVSIGFTIAVCHKLIPHVNSKSKLEI